LQKEVTASALIHTFEHLPPPLRDPQADEQPRDLILELQVWMSDKVGIQGRPVLEEVSTFNGISSAQTQFELTRRREDSRTLRRPVAVSDGVSELGRYTHLRLKKIEKIEGLDGSARPHKVAVLTA
jgi:hypothetical protein